jgi:type I restriction enzyme, S subunit
MKVNWVNIPEVLFFQEGPGVRKWQFKDKGVKLLNGGNINKGKLNLSSTKLYLSEEEAYGKYNHFLADEGDLIFACSGVVVDNFHNKITFVKKEHLPLCMNTSTMRFKVLDESIIDIVYVKYYLQTRLFSGQLRRLITGSAQLNFGPSHIKKIKIPLPSLSEQKRIAGILDAADSYRQKTKALIAKYDALTQSLFLDMFGDPITNPLGWDMFTNDDINIKIVDCPHSTPKYVDSISNYPCIRTSEIKNGSIEWKSMKYLNKENHIERIARLEPLEDDLIFGREGLVGEIALIPKNISISLGQRVMLFRVNKKIILPLFYHALIMSNGIQQKIKSKTIGATVKRINIKDVKLIELPVPPLTLQNQFADRVAVIEKQKALAQDSLVQAEDLFNSLLQKAFKGEL